MLVGLTSLTPESAFSAFDILEFFIRIVLAGVLGVIIGLERSKRLKEAGIRTHCIIAVGAAVFMILSKYAFADMTVLIGDRPGGADPSRIASQVVNGISFLGAGVIFKHNASIKGLTTAAGIWATAAVGMAIGSGMYWVGLISTAVLVLIQFLLHRFPVGKDSFSMQSVSVRMDNDEATRARFDELVKKHDAVVEQSSISLEKDQLSMQIDVRLTDPITYEEALNLLETCEGVHEISV